MKINVISLGCPKNLTDTEAVMGLLVAAGHELCAEPAVADVVIINTCAFISDAVRESSNTIKQISELKMSSIPYTSHPLYRIIIMGCLPQRLKHEFFKKFPHVDAIVGPGDIHRMLEVIDSLDKQRQAYLGGEHCLFGHKHPRLKATVKHFAYIKIADGCDNRCSYCIVPSLRGKFRSRPMQSIVAEVRNLAKHGLKEAILVAQDTTMYGTDIYGRSMLHKLCIRLSGIKGLKWIRIMYAHPAHVTDELIDTMAKYPKICRYLDLPIQHACDRILRSMRRRYSANKLKVLIDNLRRRIPGIAIRTSVIVGYPGESNKDFKQLIDFVKEERFTRLGVFRYSRESGTSAAKLGDQVSERIKEKRFHKLMRLQRSISRKSLKSMMGKVIDILAEGHVGRSFMDAPEIDGVVKLNKNVPDGKIVPVKITGSGFYDLSGRIQT